ncbi:MAG: glycosyltransferase [Desulfurococcaceae archaeon]
MTIYIVSSGGGHTGYAIAVAEALFELNEYMDIKFIVDPFDKWSIMRIRKRIVNPKYVYVSKPRNPLESFSKLLARIPVSLIESLINIEEPEAIIATGSNHSITPILAGLVKKAKLLISIEAVDRIHTYSIANKKLHDYVKIPIALHWIEQLKNYSRGFVTGPIYEKPLYKTEDHGFILVLTGSMGHLKLIKLLLETDLDDVVIQSGKVEPSFITSRKPHWRVFRFDPDIDYWISKASVVLGHQGLSIVEAALSYRKPVILVYNPDLPQTSGLIDSILLAEKLNGLFINPDEVKPSELVEAIEKAKKEKPFEYGNGSLKLAKIVIDSIS